MKKVIAIPGSNSLESINKKLAMYVANQVKEAEVESIDLNDYNLPIYGSDEEKLRGIPMDAKNLDNKLSEGDAYVISLAEHNGSYSVAFKNAFDWLSRIDGNVWKEKPMLLLSTSPGERGGATVLEAAKVSFPYLGGNIIDSYAFPSFYDNFKEDRITNSEIDTRIQQMVENLEVSIR
jgi:chromate reductase